MEDLESEFSVWGIILTLVVSLIVGIVCNQYYRTYVNPFGEKPLSKICDDFYGWESSHPKIEVPDMVSFCQANSNYAED
jgi:hypothetical protein